MLPLCRRNSLWELGFIVLLQLTMCRSDLFTVATMLTARLCVDRLRVPVVRTTYVVPMSRLRPQLVTGALGMELGLTATFGRRELGRYRLLSLLLFSRTRSSMRFRIRVGMSVVMMRMFDPCLGTISRFFLWGRRGR